VIEKNADDIFRGPWRSSADIRDAVGVPYEQQKCQTYATPLQPMPVFIPPADEKLIAEVSRLHAVIGRYREAWATTSAELDQVVTDEDGVVTIDDLEDWDSRFGEVNKFYEGR
jgi:hypothetical protein